MLSKLSFSRSAEFHQVATRALLRGQVGHLAVHAGIANMDNHAPLGLDTAL